MTPSPGTRRPVAVVMLTWNGLRYTKESVTALHERTAHPEWRLVIVDNGSTDGTVEWLRAQPGLTVVANERNLGFTRGCNIGIAATAPDEDVVLLNNDVVVTDPQWLTGMQDAAYARPTTGIVGGRLLDGQGRVAHLGSYMRPLARRGFQMGGGELFVNQCAGDRPVEAVVFAQAYLRRDCIDRIGLLDESYFAYYEDSDYCLRAQQAGFDVVCAGRGHPAVHHENSSTRENKADFWSVYEHSRKLFERRWGHWLEHERYEDEVVWHSVVNRPPGYAMQSRNLMVALHFAGLRVAYRNAYGEREGPAQHPLIDDLRARRPQPTATQLAFCQADAFPRVRGRRRIGWTMLEVTGLPREWVDGCNAMDEVWVPGTFNVETFQRSGVRVPLRVMPLGVDVGYFNPDIEGFRASDRFTFLSVFEWGERKAPELLLRAFAEEFKESEDALLLLSVYNRDPSVDVRAEIARLALPPCPPIVVMVNAEFAGHQMGALYRSADCFVLPTRGEGWGMPVLEAMACGLPTIATNWSAPADFLHPGVGYPIDVRRLTPAEARCPYYLGFEWAEPDFEHLRTLMRQVFEAPDEARARGRAAAVEVASNYTWEHAARRVSERLRALA